MKHIAIAATLLIACGSASAGEFDGYCFAPDADGIAQRIANDSWDNMEGSCSMANPEAVRGMDAFLYDVTCSGDWGSSTHRMFFLKTQEGQQAFAAAEYGTDELTRCAE